MNLYSVMCWADHMLRSFSCFVWVLGWYIQGTANGAPWWREEWPYTFQVFWWMCLSFSYLTFLPKLLVSIPLRTIEGGLLLFCVDILAFAGMAFVLMGILKKFKFSNKKLIIVAVSLSIIGSLLRFTDFGNPDINLICGHFFGTKFTAFPLFNWFIFPIAGYIWGQYFIRAKDKREFFKFWPILMVISLIYFFVSSNLWGGVFSENVHFYYFLNTLDAVFCIINAHAVIGLCYWMVKYLPDAVINTCSILSSNINKIYIAQWFFIPVTIVLIESFAKGLVLNDLITAVISIVMLIISTAVALLYKKLRASISQSRKALI